MLLIAKKGITKSICYFINRYAKANNKYMKDYNKIKESPDLRDWDINNLFGRTMLQKLPVNNFK